MPLRTSYDIKREIEEIASLLTEVAVALRNSPESVVFANGGTGTLSINPRITPISFDAHSWPDVKRIMDLLGRLKVARDEEAAQARRV